MGASIYDAGDVVTLSNVFTVDPDATPTDPETVQFGTLAPDGTTTWLTYPDDTQLRRDDAGTYHVDLLIDQGGPWWYRWIGSGTATGTEWARFYARRAPVVLP